MGGTPPPFTESLLSFSGIFFFLKGLKIMYLYKIRLKMDQKGHITDQKRLEMFEKRQKMEFSDLKYLLFSGIFFSGIGGYPPP